MTGEVEKEKNVESKGTESIEERVTNIVCEQMGVSRDKVTRETSFVNDLGADSLDVVELMMALEEAFDIEVPDDDLESMRTIGDVQRYVAHHA